MVVLRHVRHRRTRELPLQGIRLGACLLVTTDTELLMLTLKAAGVLRPLSVRNPLRTHDQTAARRAVASSQDALWWSRATARVAAAWRRAPRGWGRTSSSPRSSRCARSRP